jgi:metallothionein
MAGYASGTVLTCSHGECGCRVRIETECDCPHADEPYVCRCGEPMVKVAGESTQATGSSAG